MICLYFLTYKNRMNHSSFFLLLCNNVNEKHENTRNVS